MIQRYISAAMAHAHYEMIEDQEPYYAEIPGVQGVWATGKTLEECRDSLLSALEDWLLFSIANGLPVPSLGDAAIVVPDKVAV